MKAVSNVFNNVRTKVISLRVFSNITFGSLDGQRRKFGAQTIARLLTSIFVTRITSGLQNILRKYRIWCVYISRALIMVIKVVVVVMMG